MKNVINFLESVGQDADLRFATQGELNTALGTTEIDPALQAAFIARDPAKIEEILGTKPIICCGVLGPEPGKEDDDEEEEPEKEDEIRMSMQHVA